MRARTISRVRIVVAVTFAAAALAAVLAQQFAPAPLAINAIAGGLAGLVLSLLETLLQGPLRERLAAIPAGLVFAFRVIVYGGVFRAIGPVALAIATALAPAAELSATGGIGLIDSFVIAILFNGFFTARALMGQPTLTAFMTGRYHRPRHEERTVLFLDLQGSTALAERLGDRDFHRFLNRLFSELADPVAEAGGEIYRYIGDEIIITWRTSEAGAADGALGCLFAIDDLVRSGRARYEAEFGAAPRLRGGMHRGPVITGEMGAYKREIVILGDTMNTAARIVETCRSTRRDFIASAAALDGIAALPPEVSAEPLGPLPLRGKGAPVELFALSREIAPMPMPVAAAV